ncbi:MarR family winged helix-turn-helix transcriptional regulator [Actinoallomurus acaciae]|uniref:MarR family winged helix-turn-helix transcriptional regulator n=1 Tax=Actinoallomurus acaciae TaxID=502577 RepID=A0ABV5YYI4_9ACTN
MPDTIPESLRGRLSYLLGTLHRRAIDLETEALTPLGIGVKQQAALDVLAGEGPMTQQRLGLRLGIDRTTIVAVVDGLQDAGLIERTRAPADRRAHLIVVTESGRAAQRRGRHLVRQAERDLLSALTDEERDAVTGLLARALPERTPPGAGR